MGKNKNKKQKYAVPDESHLWTLPAHLTTSASSSTSTSTTPIVDTHTHLLTTFSAYKTKYPAGKFDTVWDFVRGVYAGRNVKAIVDVWCEAPVQRAWRELADSAISELDRKERWGGIEYWFVMGVHPCVVFPLDARVAMAHALLCQIFRHEAKLYDDAVERSILEAMTHPRCVGWGEIGLDYHYNNSPRDIQQEVFARQLRAAVKLGKPLTIHTREAEEDTERILKQHVPAEYKVHVHCFTDSPAFARRLLDHFPNLYIGITGVISYSTNLNTATVVRQMIGTDGATESTNGPTTLDKLRILLETDAPFMVPSNLYGSMPELKGKRLPLCHTAMIPWVADFTVEVVGGQGGDGTSEGKGWGPAEVMRRANENARWVYGV